MPYFPMPDARDTRNMCAGVPEDVLAQVLSASRGERVVPEELRSKEMTQPPAGDAIAQLREHSTRQLQAYTEAMGRSVAARDDASEDEGVGAAADRDAIPVSVQPEQQVQAAKRSRVPRPVAGAFSANAHYAFTQRGGKANEAQNEAHNVLSLGI